eukprot:COSAG06_NODE_4050_length_4631_cov_2.710062_6_plen_94_part_00
MIIRQVSERIRIETKQSLLNFVSDDGLTTKTIHCQDRLGTSIRASGILRTRGVIRHAAGYVAAAVRAAPALVRPAEEPRLPAYPHGLRRWSAR